MRTFAKFVFLASVCFICVSAIGPEWHAAKITVHVSDDAGNAVSGIKINASTWGRHIPGDNFGTDKDKIVTGKTDKNGFVTFSISCALDYETVSMGLGYGTQVPLAGYYGNRGGINFTNVSHGKWQPWNPVLELNMDRIINPIPMYARKVWDSKIPAEATPVGFDLVAGDWMAPYGKGQTADLIFTLLKTTNEVVLM